MGETSAEAYARVMHEAASKTLEGVVIAKGSIGGHPIGPSIEERLQEQRDRQRSYNRTRLHYFGLAGRKR